MQKAVRKEKMKVVEHLGSLRDTLEWLKARAEAVAEVMAWHTARVRLKAAKGWLAWECLGEPAR